MLKNDNAHALRLKAAIQIVAGEEEANRFAEKYPLSKSANISRNTSGLAISVQHWKSSSLVKQTLSAGPATVEMAKPWLVRYRRAFKKQKASL